MSEQLGQQEGIVSRFSDTLVLLGATGLTLLMGPNRVVPVPETVLLTDIDFTVPSVVFTALTVGFAVRNARSGS